MKKKEPKNFERRRKNCLKIFRRLIPDNYIKKIVLESLNEDVGKDDITTKFLNIGNNNITARIVAKERGIIAGIPIAKKVKEFLSYKLKIKFLVREGDEIIKNQVIANVYGCAYIIMRVERVVLNFLQHLSGIATLTHQFVESAYPVKVFDTRKTIPGIRLLQKYAVLVGGGYNHRFGLYDGILIKDNHIKICGSVKKTLERINKGIKGKIEIEVKNLREVKEVLKYDVDVIMLDNMSIGDIKKAVILINKKAKIEVSGGMSIKKARKLSKLPIDFISVGALTHSAPSIDFSMQVM